MVLGYEDLQAIEVFALIIILANYQVGMGKQGPAIQPDIRPY